MIGTLIECAEVAPIVENDALFFTGLCAADKRLKMRNQSGFLVNGTSPNACQIRNAIIAHGFDADALERTWFNLQKPDAKC